MKRYTLLFLIMWLLVVPCLAQLSQSTGNKDNKDVPCSNMSISAIRRVNVIADYLNSNSVVKTGKKPYVEIEITSQKPIEIGNAQHLVAIGEAVFYVHGWSDDLKKATVLLTSEEFGNLKDNAPVAYIVGANIESLKAGLKEKYKNVEFSDKAGIKGCRFDKKMIDKFPTVERNAVQQ